MELEIIKRLIRFETTHNNLLEKKKCLDYIDDLLLKKFSKSIRIEKFKVEKNPSRLYFFGNSKDSSIIVLNGHIDVVAGPKKSFFPKLVENSLKGRGSYDMKAAVGVFLWLFLTNPDLMRKKNVYLMIVSDEESHNKACSSKYILEKLLSKGIKIRFCINGEPTDLEIVREAKGRIFYRVRIEGISAHSARPWLGKNPIHQFIELGSRIYKLFPPLFKEEWKTTCEITMIETSKTTSLNTIPEYIECAIDIRYIPKNEEEDKVKKLKRYLDKFSIISYSQSPPIHTSSNNLYIAVLKNVLKKNNIKPVFRRGHGTSDLRFFTEKGIPGVGFGPKGKGAHSNDEVVYIDSLYKYFNILKEFLEEI